MSGEFDDDLSEQIGDDFFSLVGQAQVNELIEVDKRRAQEAEDRRLLAEKNKESVMSLMQIAGMKSQKELDKIAAEKDSAEIKQSEEEERKRKALENAKLKDQFPPPTITNS